MVRSTQHTREVHSGYSPHRRILAKLSRSCSLLHVPLKNFQVRDFKLDSGRIFKVGNFYTMFYIHVNKINLGAYIVCMFVRQVQWLELNVSFRFEVNPFVQ